jgi:hypothetical protein
MSAVLLGLMVNYIGVNQEKKPALMTWQGWYVM